MSRRIGGTLRKLGKDGAGTAAVITALAAVVLFGFAALAVDVARWEVALRKMQGAADAAALSAAVALGAGASSANVVDEGKGVAAANQFVAGQSGTAVAINNPPASGPNHTNNSAVEVIISQPQTTTLAAILGTRPPTVQARAVALVNLSATACIIGLNPTAAGTVSLSNNAVVPNPNCLVASNSNASGSLSLSNNATIDAGVNVVGTWSLSNNAALNGKPNLQHASPAADPYAGVNLQPAPACTAQSGSGSNNCTANLNPGHFCGGFNFSNNCTVNLAPGAYYVDNQMNFSNNVTVNAKGGVTLIVNGNYSFDISNNTILNITAPSSGPYAGLAFFGPRNSSPSVQQTFDNNSTLNITGAVYFPSQTINFNNNAETSQGGCTQIIGNMINLSNNVDLDNNCAGTGVTPVTIGASAKLAE